MFKHLKISAPGKIILCGEHAVVYGKKALASAIDLRTIFHVVLNDSSQQLEVQLLDTANQHVKFERDDFDRVTSEFQIKDDQNLNDIISILNSDNKLLNSVKFMIISLRKFLSWSVLKQIKIEISTAIPIGSGLGSSGSFAVCLASTFLILAKTIDLKNHPNLTRDDLNLINKYAFFIEKIFHGNPSGIDNTVSTFGNYVVYKKGFDIESFSVNLNLPILVVNSCLPKKTIEQVAKVRDLYNKHMLVIEPLFESIENIVNKYVLILKETRNISELNDLISINQGILNCLQVSNLELNKIIDISQSFGFQAKITGAGGGGCCYVLLDQSTELKKNLIQKLNENSFVSFEVCLGDKGILIDEIAF